MRPSLAFEPDLAAYLISLAISAAVAARCWERRAWAAGASAYAVVAFSQASWTLGYVLELSSPSLVDKLFWDSFQYIGAAGWAVGFFAFAVQYTGRQLAHPTLAYGLASLPFAGLVLLALTGEWPGLVRSRIRLVPIDAGPVLLYDFGPVVWAVALYGCALLLVSFGMLAVKYVGAPPVFHLQHGLVLLGNAIPMVGIGFTLTVLRDSPSRDLSPLTFAVANLIVASALGRFHLFDLIPVARSVVIEGTSEAVYVLDARGRIIDLNPAARRMTPGASFDVVGRRASEVFARWPNLVARVESGERGRGVVEVEAAGDTRFIELRVHRLRRGAGRKEGRVIVMRDVTEQQRTEEELRRHRDRLEELVRERTAELQSANEELWRESDERARLEAQFHHAQKMEAVGRLAGGVAHDFNNLLTVIIGHGELLLRAPAAQDPQDREDLEGIVKAARQAAVLTQQLLAFGRKQVLQPAVLAPNVVLREMEPMLRRLVGEDVELSMELRSDIGHVMVDPSRFQQIVMNLVINARDAMPRGGRVRIETAETTLGDSDVRGRAAHPGRFVRLSVSDTGVGMDPTVQQRIFEPFFTTKEKGKGTGLGLATVHGIVEQSGGVIAVESERGRGSTLIVYLPRTEAPAEEAQAAIMPAELHRGGETILVVEDDALVRGFIQRALRASGYQVLVAGDAQEALAVADRHPAPIHLLVTDVVMPGRINGRELAEMLRRSRASMRVVYMSGYADDVIVRHGVVEPGVYLLQKPFPADALRSMVREALTRAGPKDAGAPRDSSTPAS